jgi:hypothetical protein
MFGSTRTSFLTGAASALVAVPALAATGDLKTVRVGTLPSASDANVIYAQDNGYFKDLGLDAKIDFMNNGNVIWDAVLGGSLDVGAGNVGSLAVARSRGIPLRIIAPGSAATKDVVSNFVIVAKDSPIRIGADFNNKTIAMTAIKTTGEAVFRMWIDKNGGDSKTIRVIELPYPAMADAVAGCRARGRSIRDDGAHHDDGAASQLFRCAPATGDHHLFCGVGEVARSQCRYGAKVRRRHASRRALGERPSGRNAPAPRADHENGPSEDKCDGANRLRNLTRCSQNRARNRRNAGGRVPRQARGPEGHDLDVVAAKGTLAYQCLADRTRRE